jgi:hypothetical protein
VEAVPALWLQNKQPSPRKKSPTQELAYNRKIFFVVQANVLSETCSFFSYTFTAKAEALFDLEQRCSRNVHA